jgi:cytochrome P450
MLNAAIESEDFNPIHPELYVKHGYPHDYWTRLRAEDPVHWIENMDLWLVTRYEDIRELYTCPHVTGDRRQWTHYKQPEEGSFFRWIDDWGLMALSRKDHARQRKLLGSGFTPRGVARMNRQIEEVVNRFAQPLHGRTGVIDIMAEFTTPIPNVVISTITGVRATGVDDARFSQLAQETIQGFFGFVSDEVRERAEKSYLELSHWVRETVRLRRDDPRDDLISDLVQAREGAYRFTDEDIVCQVSALLAAGSETTATGGVTSISTLLDHPESLERVREDRSLIPQTVNEILRFSFGGLMGTQRFATRDFEFKGKPIKKGQLLVLSMGGASHDPARYDDPDTFDIDRCPDDLLTFGIGPHYCLGANLAKGELVCMIDAALDFLPPGAKVRKEQIQVQSLGAFDRTMTCPVDFGDGG